MSVFLRNFPLHRVRPRTYGTSGCSESINILSTTLKVNIFTFICFSIGTSSLTRLLTLAHMNLKSDIQELRQEIKELKQPVVQQ